MQQSTFSRGSCLGLAPRTHAARPGSRRGTGPFNSSPVSFGTSQVSAPKLFTGVAERVVQDSQVAVIRLASAAPAQPPQPLMTSDDLRNLLGAIGQLEQKNAELQQQLAAVAGALTASAQGLDHGRQPGCSGVSLSAPATNNSREPPAARSSGLDLPGPQPYSQGATTSCVIQHPGALCCTTTTVALDTQNEGCTITLQTSARVAQDDAGSLTYKMDDLMALAAQAQFGSASDFCRAQTQRINTATQSTERLQMHEQICRILQGELRGEILAVERKDTSQFGHVSYVVQLKDPVSSRRIRAVLKPRVEGDSQGWHRVPIEYVAYQLNLMLGMDAVPPVAYRSNGIDVDNTHYNEGAMIYWSEDAKVLDKVPQEKWGVRRDVLLSNTRILDCLLHNSDRHHGNYLLGRHWVEGHWENGRWRGDMCPILIDHAAGFREEALVTMLHENAFQTGPVTIVAASTYLRLRFLDASAIASRLSEHLTERELREMLQRRTNILRYLDQLVDEQGYSKTVVDNS